jgi:hypothetical protein
MWTLNLSLGFLDENSHTFGALPHIGLALLGIQETEI